jgi:assimilatory nitrate reductase catalytic subunit
MMADIHLAIKPRSDIALLNGIAHILLREGLIDHNYIAQHTNGFEEFAEFVSTFTPANVAATTGLTEEQIIETAHLYGRAKTAFVGWTMGVNHSTQDAVTVAAINNLALITGNIGRAGAAPFSITGQCNAMGTREAGFTSSLPGYRKFDNPTDREDLARIWNIPVDRIPTARGLAYPDIIEAAVQGKVKALWFIATNPAVSFPNYKLLEHALRSVEFLVVQDGFHPTPTSEFADLVLPAAIWAKRKARIPTPSAASPRPILPCHLPAKPAATSTFSWHLQRS